MRLDNELAKLLIDAHRLDKVSDCDPPKNGALKRWQAAKEMRYELTREIQRASKALLDVRDQWIRLRGPAPEDGDRARVIEIPIGRSGQGDPPSAAGGEVDGSPGDGEGPEDNADQ